MDNFEGKGAVVTGGASGIGLATARILGRRGAQLVLADIEKEALNRAVEELGEEGIQALGVECDVRSYASVTELADQAWGALGSVHVVFNNAGVAMAGALVDMSHDDWRWIIDVDLWGPIHGVEAFASRMVDQGEGGHILFTSSFAGLVPNVGLGPYVVAKYGVVGLAEVLRRELRGHDIGVSVLCPMRVDTNINASARNRADDYGRPEASPEMPDLDQVPEDLAGRVLDVEDVAAMSVDAIVANRLYVLPHIESRDSIRRRFERIDRTFDEQEFTAG